MHPFRSALSTQTTDPGTLHTCLIAGVMYWRNHATGIPPSAPQPVMKIAVANQDSAVLLLAVSDSASQPSILPCHPFIRRSPCCLTSF